MSKPGAEKKPPESGQNLKGALNRQPQIRYTTPFEYRKRRGFRGGGFFYGKGCSLAVAAAAVVLFFALVIAFRYIPVLCGGSPEDEIPGSARYGDAGTP